MRQIKVPAVSLLAATLLICSGWQSPAASRWHTTRTVAGQTQPLSAGTSTIIDRQGDIRSVVAATVSDGLIDLVISLYNNPQGDNDGNTQDVDPDSVAQDAYERIIQYFADGVYESTEGVHTLRNVRIYRSGSRQDADVIWENSGGPCAGLMNQDGIAAHISMFNRFSGSIFTNTADHEVGGYILAHEMGHYFYGLLDEYCRWDGGTYPARGSWSSLPDGDRTVPAIMNNQWAAAGRDYRWLNHSIGTDAEAPFNDYECRPRTAQRQFYAAGAWPTLARNPDDDPLDTASRRGLRDRWGKRVFYPEIAAAAPAGTNRPSITLDRNLPLADLPSREHLNIIWMSTNIAMMVVLDKSGSMERHDRLQNAKTAAKLLVDQLPEGSALGVIAFDENVEPVRNLAVLATPAQRTAAQAAIDTITAGGWTAIGDAAEEALTQLEAFDREDWLSVVFLLSDGQSNHGRDPLSVIAAYQNAQMPIMSFGFGTEAEIDARLPDLANLTGGRYRYAPDGLFDITAAFRDALSEVAARPALLDERWNPGDNAGARAAVSLPFSVDGTITDFTAVLGHDLADSATLHLRAPNGSLHHPAATNQSGGERLLQFNIASPGTGVWHVAGICSGSLHCQIHAGTAGFTYHLTASTPGGDTIAFPAPVRIVARLTREAAIAGAVVQAEITDPDGTVTMLPLTADTPGAYSGIFLPSSNGRHVIVVAADNSAGAAFYTWADALYSIMQDGTLPPEQPDEPITENFSRSVTLQVTVTGVEQVTPPAAPPGVTASAGDFPGYVRVTWEGVAQASVYEVWRSDTAGGAGAMIAEVAPDYCDYMDSGITAGRQYYYRVRGVNQAGTGAYSATAAGWPLFGPGIRVNGARAAAISSADLAEITLLLSAGDYRDLPCDWWVAAHDPAGNAYHYLGGDLQWYMAGTLDELRPAYTGPLFDIDEPFVILRARHLPPGTYYLYFGLDWTPNGRLDQDTLYYEQPVTILQVR